MPPTPTPSAKDRVLAWVREKNPQTMELKFGCVLLRGEQKSHYQVILGTGFAMDQARCWVSSAPFGQMPLELEKDLIKNGGEWEILGSDMGLQELLIALALGNHYHSVLVAPSATSHKECFILSEDANVSALFDLTKTLHNQAPDFYEALLTLLP